MSKQNDQRLYEQQEKKMRGQSDVFVSFLTKRGLLGDTKIDDERVRAAQKAKKKNSFHNTQLLLKHYRNIAWMIECFPGSIAEDLNKPFSGIDELLDYVDVEGVLENRRLEGRIEAIKKTKILLDRVNEALTVLRKKPDNGEQLYKINPDIVIIAGDLFDNYGSTSQTNIELSRVSRQLRKIQSRDGVILTLGNHDPVASNEAFQSFLRESNIKLVNNEVIEHLDFYVIGRTDPYRNLRDPIDNLICMCTKEKPRIIVDHDPQYISEAVSCNADLILSGHTHAGQFFPASTFVRFVMGKEKFYGHHLIGKTHCIISAGAGVFNLPVRIGTRNEIVDLTLEPEVLNR